MDTQILNVLIVIAGVQIALKGLASPHWEVRNAGGMCFSALALRMLGFKNEGNRSSVTSSQLFQRFPQLLPVLVHQLEAGLQKLVSTAALHPALFPILALLSRLRYNWGGVRLSVPSCSHEIHLVVELVGDLLKAISHFIQRHTIAGANGFHDLTSC